MTATKRTLAVLAVVALAAPVVAAPAFAFSAVEAPTAAPKARFDADRQTLSVASDATALDLARDSYAVEVRLPVQQVVAAVTPNSGSAAQADAGATATFAAPPQGYSGENIVAYAWEFVGKVPYGMGNDPSDSFSCDGYVQYVFAAYGIQLPRTANAQAALGTPIPASEARAGDLLWWPDTHIAIYDGNGGMLDSPFWGRNVRHRADLWNDPIFIRLNV